MDSQGLVMLMPGICWIEMVLGWLAMPVALLINPLLLARITHPEMDRRRLPLVGALWSLLLQPLVALLFHLLQIPIAPLPLVGFHIVLCLSTGGVLWIIRRSFLPQSGEWPREQLWLFLLLAVLIFPFTHLGGIDAYKWGDLATAVALEQSIPWLAHPLSLFGYTPRSYPSLHPLLMGAIRALAGTGLASAFYLASLVICAVAVTAAGYLADTLCLQKRNAWLYTAFYVLSPVFMRYVHWGTGRGAFLAVLPLFVAALLQMPRLRAWGLFVLSGLLLMLAHKTGLVCVLILPLLRLAAPMYPRRRPTIRLFLLLLSFAASIFFSPVRYFGWPLGSVAGWIRYDLARFGWISPALLATAVVAPGMLFKPTGSAFMWLALLVTFPAAHHMEMYPAMLALPFIVYGGMMALQTLRERLPAIQKRGVQAALLLTLLGALAIVIQRSVEATPHRVYLAARYIERIDPYGPFEIVSPWRSRIQGMVTGCPRFTVERDKQIAVSLGHRRPPGFTLNVRRFVQGWIGYLRNMFQTGVYADWYGHADTRYHVLPVTHSAPAHTTPIYNHAGVAIYREKIHE